MRMSSLALADSMRRDKTVRHVAIHRIDQHAQFSAEHRRRIGGTTRSLVNIVSPLSQIRKN